MAQTVVKAFDPVLFWAEIHGQEILNETGISEAGKFKKWVSARNALTQLLVGSHGGFLAGAMLFCTAISNFEVNK